MNTLDELFSSTNTAQETARDLRTSMPEESAAATPGGFTHTWSFYTNTTARLAIFTLGRLLDRVATGRMNFVLKEQEEFKYDSAHSLSIIRTGLIAACYAGQVVKLELVNGHDKQDLTLVCENAAAGRALRQLVDEELRLRNPYRGKFLHLLTHRGDLLDLTLLPKPEETLAELILEESVKVDLLDNTLLQLQLGLSNGLLFTGAPGTGKSLAAKTLCRAVVEAGYTAIFAEGRLPFDELDVLVRQFIGPCLLVLEDIDTFAEDRLQGHPTAFSDFLQFLSGMATRPDPLVIIATTNHLELLDAAVKNRPARFNRRYEFRPPDQALLNRMIDSMFGPAVIPDPLKELCHQRAFTGAHINEIRRTARTLAHKQAAPLAAVFAEAVERVASHFSPELRTLGFGTQH